MSAQKAMNMQNTPAPASDPLFHDVKRPPDRWAEKLV